MFPEKATETESAASTFSGEKPHASYVEQGEAVDAEKGAEQHAEVYNVSVDISGVDERKLIRKLDLHLIPWLAFLYLLSFLDRTSIGNAKVRTLSCWENLWMASDEAGCSYMGWRRISTLAISST